MGGLFSYFKGLLGSRYTWPGGQAYSAFFPSVMILCREMRILILGLDGAGKTTILYRLQAGEVLMTLLIDTNISHPKSNYVGGDNNPYDWIQCWDSDIQEPQVPSLGSWRTDQHSTLLAVLLHQHRCSHIRCRQCRQVRINIAQIPSIHSPHNPTQQPRAWKIWSMISLVPWW